jgi:hypothetical protein
MGSKGEQQFTFPIKDLCLLFPTLSVVLVYLATLSISFPHPLSLSAMLEICPKKFISETWQIDDLLLLPLPHPNSFDYECK